MGNETTKLKVQKPSLSLEPTSSMSRSYNSANYKYSADTYTPWSAMSAITPDEPSSSLTNGNNKTPVGGVSNNDNAPSQFNIINGANTNSLTANMHNQSTNYHNSGDCKYDKEPINTINGGVIVGRNRLPLTNGYSNTNTLGVTTINVTKLSLDTSQQYSNSSTCNGYNNINGSDHSIIPKITPLELSPTDSLSYSQRLGIAADQPLPQLMMNDEEIYTKNQGRRSMSEKKKKKKKRIFKFNKNKTKPSTPIDTKYNNNNNNDRAELNIAVSTLSKTKSLSISTVATTASRRRSVARSRARPNAKRKGSVHYIDYKQRSQHKSPRFSKDVTHSHKLKTKNSRNNMESKKKRRQSIANSKVNNGITGKYISEKIANCAALFWIQNIDVLKRKDQLEIGCLQYFYLLEQHPEVKQFFAKDKIEETALRFFDMFGWLIRSLTLDGVNLWRVLTKIGGAHCSMDIKVHHYALLLDAFHHAMSKSFTQNYTIEVKYCIDQIFTIATCIMTGHNYDQLSFGERVLELNDCRFLRNFNTCLDNEIGREYLYRYLGQTYCSEIVIFLQLYQEYTEIFSGHHQEKLIKAKSIGSISLSQSSEFPINVSYAANEEFWARLKQCERDYETNSDSFTIDPLLFDTIWDEVTKLILNNHWGEFVSTVKKMQRQQNSVLNH